MSRARVCLEMGGDGDREGGIAVIRMNSCHFPSCWMLAYSLSRSLCVCGCLLSFNCTPSPNSGCKTPKSDSNMFAIVIFEYCFIYHPDAMPVQGKSNSRIGEGGSHKHVLVSIQY